MKTVYVSISKRCLYILASVLFVPWLALFNSVDPQKVDATTETITSTSTWTAPTDVYYVTVEAWGGGGGGGNLTTGAAGGGGGAYASDVLRVTPGNSYTITIGTGGSPGASGGDTSFTASISVIAKGGSSGSSGIGGSGGSATNSTGEIKFSGGNGGNVSANGRGGGGGGGSATSMANGGAGGVANNGGIGGTGQGSGGVGGGNNTNGVNGSIPGGGGGGGGNNATSGSGARGQVVLNYTTSIISVSVSDGSISYGIVPAGSSKSTTAADLNNTQTATNDGSITEDFNIRGSHGGVWTLADSVGNDQYVHNYCITGSGSPDPCDGNPVWNTLTTSYQSLAIGVPVESSVRFDLQLIAPTSSSTSTTQSVNITIQAVAH